MSKARKCATCGKRIYWWRGVWAHGTLTGGRRVECRKSAGRAAPR